MRGCVCGSVCRGLAGLPVCRRDVEPLWPCLAGKESVQEREGRRDARPRQLQLAPQLVDERARGDLELLILELAVTIRTRRRLLKLVLRDERNPGRHSERAGI